MQAVKHSGLKMCQAVFYKAGEVQITESLTLRCETPGIVILHEQSQNSMKITVTDPNLELGKMLLSITARVEKEGENFKAVWNEKEKVSELTIDLPKGHFAGSSVTIKL
ncbi:MAG: polysaccharide lyase beta-sandwich domain-containing protein [Draconibacterium sp.]|nr:polysaccharide lyase beta-sandwich domain-containing protein [Draconibacterium sp.]